VLSARAVWLVTGCDLGMDLRQTPGLFMIRVARCPSVVMIRAIRIVSGLLRGSVVAASRVVSRAVTV
jgi:hypothetical protein